MRDLNRIIRITALVIKIWNRNPDMRLLQLLNNPFPDGDNYFVEDNCLEDSLKKYYNIE